MSEASFLKTIKAFRSLGSGDLKRLASHCRPVRFAASEKIVRLGEPGDALFIIREGRAAAPILDEQGQEKLLARLGPGDIFGEMALLTGEPRTADVIAETEIVCLKLQKEPLHQLMREHTAVASFLTTILGQRLLEGGNIRSVGRYRIVGELGSGGMAMVFEGRHQLLGSTVAIKMLSHQLVYDQEFSVRFKEESRIMAGLRHDNIVKVIDFEEAYATFFIIMEKINGTDLHSMIRARGVIPIDEVRSIVLQLALALDYAHSRGIIHRDVKPGNVIIEPNGRVKLMDFGIAKTRAEAAQESEDVLGTPEYMSPEHSQGVPLDGRTDIYSLGILTYEMLVGRPPFHSADCLETFRAHEEDQVPPPRLSNPKIPADLDEVVRVALQKNPEDRFQHAREIATLLGGAKPEHLELARARTRTLSLFYDGRQEDLVDAFLKKVRDEAGQLPGVRLSLPESGQVE